MPRGRETLELLPPSKGAIASDAPHRLPPDAAPIDATANVIMRDGWLVNRPGYAEIDADVVDARPMGIAFYKEGTTKRIVIATLNKWYSYSGGTYTDLNASLTGTASDHVRFALWPTGTSLVVMGVNGALNEAVYEWAGTGSAALTTGAYAADDITVSTNRVILARTFEGGVEQYYRVRWSAFNDRETWSASGFADLSDTPDLIVGARSLKNTAFAIHKEESQWVGIGRSGLFPFEFQIRDTKPGPVSTAAIVNAEGRHWYMSVDGSIYMFDGTRCTHVGEAIRRYLVRNLNFDLKKRVFGVYLARDRDIWWFFPENGNDDCSRAISMNVDTLRFFVHNLSESMSAGAPWDFIATITWDSLAGFTWDNIAATYSTWDSFGSASIPADLLGGVDGKIHGFGIAATDNGNTVTAQWRVGPLPIGGAGKRARVESLDTYFEQSNATISGTVAIGSTDTLAGEPTNITTGALALGTASDKVQDYSQSDAGIGTGLALARFVSVDHTVGTTGEWRWAGGVLRFVTSETGSQPAGS